MPRGVRLLTSVVLLAACDTAAPAAYKPPPPPPPAPVSPAQSESAHEQVEPQADSAKAQEAERATGAKKGAGHPQKATASNAKNARETEPRSPPKPREAIARAPEAPAKSAPEPAPARAPQTPPPTPAKPAPEKVRVPSTAHVRVDIPAGLQTQLDRDPRMQPWSNQVIAIIDRCYQGTTRVADSIEVRVTLHENERPDADILRLPPSLTQVVSCATGSLMRVKMPLFTGPEGARHTVRIQFTP